MKNLRFMVFIGGFCLLTGCATKEEKKGANPTVDLPITTPFDASPFQRHAYLQAYGEGYRSAQQNGDFTPPFRQGPHPFARELGWRAGAAAAYKEGYGPAQSKE
jgi:hypothetical protein